MLIESIVESGNITAKLSERILGRCPCEDVLDLNEDIVLKAGEIIEEIHIEKIDSLGLKYLKIRSVLTCESFGGICAKCYGRDLARGTPVNLGEPVGIIAAQSIGEPGTQLTMRTFHIGGAVSSSIVQSSTISPIDGVVSVENLKSIIDERKNKILLTRNAKIKIFDKNNEEFSFSVAYGARIYFDAKQDVLVIQPDSDFFKYFNNSSGRN